MKSKRGRPDNLPGSSKTIKKYLVTVFVQLKYKNNGEEEISKIYFINHSDLKNNIKLVEPKNYQKKKRIQKVIDFDSFEKNNSHYVFNTEEKLYMAFKLNKIKII